MHNVYAYLPTTGYFITWLILKGLEFQYHTNGEIVWMEILGYFLIGVLLDLFIFITPRLSCTHC